MIHLSTDSEIEAVTMMAAAAAAAAVAATARTFPKVSSLSMRAHEIACL